MRKFAKFIALGALISSPLASADTAEQDLKIQLRTSPTESQILNIYQSNPNSILEILAILLSNENVDAAQELQTAMEIAPDRAQEIAELARELGVSNEIITTAALLAGVDPTQVSVATAAGFEQTIANIVAPSVPPVGTNGGGGNGVVSPN
ncbi:hypothetical protein AB4259_22065 [Vibrio amylolyticus]|uniref:hypothetical protein n=1 Tax=Vibrio amylolyticus TaxID=2847292 RepID=UPI003551722E